MNEIININYSSDRPTVLGRELHDMLGVNSNYTTWFNRMCDYGFKEHVDFETCFPNLESENQHGGQNKVDHQLTIPMAKEICMLQRTERGKECRQYFIKIEEQWNSPDAIMQRALQIANSRVEKLRGENQILLEQNTAMQPKALFADSVCASSTSILIGELAKILKQNGVATGQNKLFAWMRDNGYLIRRKGADYNMPTQRSMEMQLFEIKETVVTHADGHTSINKTTKVTGKGQVYFVNKLCAGV
ncbi:MAG: phage antirepressor KilAC domain-containing protein [Clostridiales bacterium]|nr:phage antirepressor KilAC domain-containing protein [Clostridiales bacterium]